MAGKAINQYNTFSGSASDVNVLVQETSQTDPNTYEHKKAKLDTIIATLKNIANGLAGLDGNGLIPESLLPAKYDDVVEGYYYNGVFYTTSAHTTAMPATTGRIYIDLGGTGNLYRYTGSAYVQVTDNDLRGDVEEDVASIGATLNQHDARIKNLEQKDGDYSIVQYRGTNAVPTGKAKYGLVKSIVGKTRAWNQLINPNYFTTTTKNGITFTANADGSITVSGTAENRVIYQLKASMGGALKGHKVYFGGCPTGGSLSTYWYGYMNGGGGRMDYEGYIDTGSGKIVTITPNYGIDYPIIDIESGTVINTPITFKPVFIDLTLIFGAGNEPTSVADAIAQLPALGQYNAYDAGSLVDTEYSGVRSVGKNLLDNVDTLLTSVGFTKTGGVYFGLPNYLYNVSLFSDFEAGQYTLSVNGRNISGTIATLAVTLKYTDGTSATSPIIDTDYSRTITITSDASKDLADITFTFYNNQDIAINWMQLEKGSTGTPYSPYMTDTLSLPETVTLRSAGSVSDELDVESGVITRKVGSVDLGTLNWSYEIGVNRARTYDLVSIIKIPADGYVLGNYLSANGYTQKEANSTLSAEGQYAVLQDGQLIFYYNGTAPSGLFAYELATPTTESIDPVPDNTLYTEGGGTIDTIQDQTPVIDNCLDVGYLAV